jgi:hypothetical protein
MEMLTPDIALNDLLHLGETQFTSFPIHTTALYRGELLSFVLHETEFSVSRGTKMVSWSPYGESLNFLDKFIELGMPGGRLVVDGDVKVWLGGYMGENIDLDLVVIGRGISKLYFWSSRFSVDRDFAEYVAEVKSAFEASGGDFKKFSDLLQ